jgi:hypothetical protein
MKPDRNNYNLVRFQVWKWELDSQKSRWREAKDIWKKNAEKDLWLYIIKLCLESNDELYGLYKDLDIHSLTGAYSPGWTFGVPFEGFLITHN